MTSLHTARACTVHICVVPPAERKSIEAAGIAEFQRIVSEGISDQLLKWKGIETTKALAESENAKIVIVGSGENGLPVIFNSA
jgi:prohibitin 1